MRTVFCPDCKAPLKMVGAGEAFFGWKLCNACSKPSYIAIPMDGDPSAATLRGLVEKVSSHKPGLDALRFLVEHDEAFIDDLLFVAGRAAYADIILLEEMHVLDRKLKTYSLRPQLKPYVEDMVAPALRVI